MAKTLTNTLKPFIFFDGMTWPDPRYASDLQWRVRYAEQSVTRNDNLVLASIATAYKELVDMPARARNKRVMQIRKAMSAAVDSRAAPK